MNYYNEIDPFAAQWLRNLIKAGLIPAGYVDERSIADVRGSDLAGYTQCHFFAGIGGWPCALELAGWDSTRPVWTGSCPCQPLSCAGKQKGHEDERHLWPEFYRLISECCPGRIFGEQVASKLGIEWVDGISLDMEALGYRVAAVDLPAASVGAPHIRQRLWWVADRDRKRFNGESICLQPRGQKQDCFKIAGCCSSFWSSSVWWPCRDGKWRRVPGRMGNTNSAQIDTTKQGQQVFSEGLLRCDGLAIPESERLQITGQEPGCSPEAPGGNGGVSDAKPQRDGAGKSGPAGRGEPANESGCFYDARHDRLETQSDFQLMVDGIPEGMGLRCHADSEAFPLSPGCQNRAGILKGAGNAIVPQVAAEFIKSFMGVANE
jgi:DNA (cytosine-5)-methyltransferase 1